MQYSIKRVRSLDSAAAIGRIRRDQRTSRAAGGNDDVTKETSTERIRDRVRQDIATGAFAPGARLTVAALARR